MPRNQLLALHLEMSVSDALKTICKLLFERERKNGEKERSKRKHVSICWLIPRRPVMAPDQASAEAEAKNLIQMFRIHELH